MDLTTLERAQRRGAGKGIHARTSQLYKQECPPLVMFDSRGLIAFICAHFLFVSLSWFIIYDPVCVKFPRMRTCYTPVHSLKQPWRITAIGPKQVVDRRGSRPVTSQIHRIDEPAHLVVMHVGVHGRSGYTVRAPMDVAGYGSRSVCNE